MVEIIDFSNYRLTDKILLLFNIKCCGISTSHYLMKNKIDSVSFQRNYTTWLVVLGIILLTYGANVYDSADNFNGNDRDKEIIKHYGLSYIILSAIILSYQIYLYHRKKIVISCGNYVYQCAMDNQCETDITNWLVDLQTVRIVTMSTEQKQGNQGNNTSSLHGNNYTSLETASVMN